MAVTCEPVSFWWVWTKYGKRPTYFHPTAESAAKEATRLAERFPKQKFIVLHAYAKFSVEPEAVEAAEQVAA